MKAFEKVTLAEGELVTETMTLSPKYFSIYDVSLGKWMPVDGIFTLHVGTSSDNLPLSIDIERSDLNVDIEIL